MKKNLHQYPDAYCVKCKTHTPTAKKHTIMLSSSARAVTGECPKCGSTVYKILPGKVSSAKPSDNPKSNVVTINHRSWLQTAAAMPTVAPPQREAFNQTSFVFGVAAGVVIMLGVIISHVYFG